jgi:hypothetical protein
MNACIGLAAALALGAVGGCASVGRVEVLEAEVAGLQDEIARLEEKDQQLTSALSKTAARLEDTTLVASEKHSVLATELTKVRSSTNGMEVRLRNVEGIIEWRGRLAVSVAGDQGWQVIYANSTGRSQMLRIRRVAPASDSTRIRIMEIPKLPKLVVSGTEQAENAGAIAVPEWDLSAIGAVRSQRLACGREISAMSTNGLASFDILILEDPHPILCK